MLFFAPALGLALLSSSPQSATAATSATQEPKEPFEQDGHAQPRLGVELECDGQPRQRCSRGHAGISCGLACDEPEESCFVEQVCHGWGAAAGLTAIGTHLFPLPEPPPGAANAEAEAASVAAALSSFVTHHPRELGLAPGITAADLDLRPTAAPRDDAGALRIFRFEQRYRGLPIVGGGRVRVVVNPKGAIAIRGAIIDGRVDYAHVEAPTSAQVAAGSILAHASAFSGLPLSELTASEPTLVSMPRTASVGWSAHVSHGAAHVATVVVAAAAAADGTLQLLLFEDHQVEELEDEVPLTLRSESFDGILSAGPVVASTITSLADGSPLLGSTDGEDIILATRRLAAFDAEGKDFSTWLDPLREALPVFTAEPGDPRFDTQRAYHFTTELYAYTDRWMHGRWESARPLLHGGQESLFAPGEFFPRGLLLTRGEKGSCPEGAPACFKLHPIADPTDEIPPVYLHPEPNPDEPDVSPLEPLGIIVFRNTLTSAATIAHEFGHFVDGFAAPGTFGDGLGCLGSDSCAASCRENTTDEASALAETWANLAALWYLRNLSAEGSYPAACALVQTVARGGDRRPHSAACRPQGQAYSQLLRDDDPACPDPALCDKPEDPGFVEDAEGNFHPTGLCNLSAGYRTNSLSQALWELLHAEECDPEPPFSCAPLPHLQAALTDSEDPIGEALLYALRLDSATYRSFVDDLVTHLACNHGSAVYDEVNAVLCHHAIRSCDAPVPVTCEMCGNGVREGSEACDGDDFGGDSCVSLGHPDGDLACAPGCTLDLAGCQDADPDPAMPDDPPPSDTDATTGATTGGVADEGGCTCQSSTAPPPWGSLAAVVLGLFALRRRRRSFRSLMAMVTLGGLGLLMPACTDRSSTPDDPPPTTTDMLDTDTDTDTDTDSLPAAPDPRLFGTFYTANVYPGWSNEDYPHDVGGSFGHRILTLTPDGLARVEVYECRTLFGNAISSEEEFLSHDELLSWTFVPELGALLIEPGDQENPSEWVESLESMVVLPHPDCDDSLSVTATFETNTNTYSHRPGRLCAEFSDFERCRYTLDWCGEGEPGPLCPES